MYVSHPKNILIYEAERKVLLLNWKNEAALVSHLVRIESVHGWHSRFEIIGVRGERQEGQLPPQKKFGEDQIRENSSGRIGKNKFLSVIKTEKFSKIGNDEQEFGY